LQTFLGQEVNHKKRILCVLSYVVLVLSSYYTNHLTIGMIAPVIPRVFESVNEIAEAGYSLVYPTAIPNVSDHASQDIASLNLGASEGFRTQFNLTREQSEKVSSVHILMSKSALNLIANPVNRSAVFLRVSDFDKTFILNRIKARVPKYTCEQCKQILSKEYLSGLVATDLAEKKLSLLKLFKSSGLINWWMGRISYAGSFNTLKSFKKSNTVYIASSNWHAVFLITIILYLVGILILLAEKFMKILSLHSSLVVTLLKK